MTAAKILPQLREISDKRLIGKRITMSLAGNRTGELWKSFMPLRATIKGAVSPGLYSLQIYPASYFTRFSPEIPFEKWAAIEVSDQEAVPDGMESMIIPAGLYAVFHYKGSSTDTRVFQYIFTEWLPQSVYKTDDRPHFELLGDNYKNADPDSQEEIWIPVKLR